MKSWQKLILLSLVVLFGVGFLWLYNQAQDGLTNYALSKKVDEAAQPIEERTIFSPEDDIYLSFDVKKFLVNAEVKVEWFRSDSDRLLSVSSSQVSGPRRVSFVAKKQQGSWQSGDYLIKVYLEDQLSQELDFKVK